MKFGVRAHDFGEGSFDWVAKELERYSVACVQLALAKSFPNIDAAPGQITDGIAEQIKFYFEQSNVKISVLGCYINPIHPDPLERELSLKRFEEHLKFAKQFGCDIVATETGSHNADCKYHPNNNNEESLMELIGVIKRLAHSAEKYGTTIGIEGVAHHHVVNTHEKLLYLLKEVNSECVKVIYDPVNFFPVELVHDQRVYIDDALEKFGKDIVAIHCKDFKNLHGIKTGELVSGEGDMLHEYLFYKTSSLGIDVPTILECTNQSNVHRAIEFVNSALSKAKKSISSR
jgi:sugar phosphate isomerase/epimerase